MISRFLSFVWIKEKVPLGGPVPEPDLGFPFGNGFRTNEIGSKSELEPKLEPLFRNGFGFGSSTVSNH